MLVAKMKKLTILGVVLLSLGLAGCSGSAEGNVSKEQEDAFKNPPKEMPAGVAEKMAKAREEGMKRAAAIRAAQGQNGAATGGAGGQ